MSVDAGKLKRLTHESSWIVGVGADFTVDFNEPLHDDLSNFGIVQGILETIAKEDDHGE